jgi:hypothetical protein
LRGAAIGLAMTRQRGPRWEKQSGKPRLVEGKRSLATIV